MKAELIKVGQVELLGGVDSSYHSWLELPSWSGWSSFEDGPVLKDSKYFDCVNSATTGC